jgi:hypothetical protein
MLVRVTITDLTARREAARPIAALSAVEGAGTALNIETSDSPDDVVDLLFLAEFTRGAQPHAKQKNVSRPKPKAPLCPEDARLLRTATAGHRAVWLYAGDGYTLRVSRWRGGTAELTVTAVTADLAKAVLKAATRDAELPRPPKKEAVKVGFWHATNGYIRRERFITAQSWDAVRPNYAADATTALDRLMNVTRDDIKGRLLLLYGPPGTGKTTVLRTLASRWRDWCQFDCVLDPERLFSDPGYLVEVAVGEDDNDRRWRLLLLEDCDELIGGGARHASGQALSRLLNLTDGMLGQGRDVLVAITTNEDVSRLHPAVVRPGRCLARVELGPLPFDQAKAWLGTADGIAAGGATLAQLYALRNGTDPITAEAVPGPAAGMYL